MEEPFKDYGEFENLGTERIVCVNVSRTYLRGERESLYECTRKYWRLNGESKFSRSGVCGMQRIHSGSLQAYQVVPDRV